MNLHLENIKPGDEITYLRVKNAITKATTPHR